MSKLFWRALKSVPAFVVGSLFVANTTVAQTAPTGETNSVNNTLEQINRYQDSSQPSMSQVTNVNQLRDVQPTDWAYEALRSLVDRYGCIAGFPNQTYRGYQALSRYEFAAGLNSCLNQIERLIASSEAVVREDLDTINRLSQEFEAELATIGGRIDSLESRTAFLEDNQFSTTTKLKGEAIFALSDTFNEGNIEEGFDEIFDEDDVEESDDPTQTTFSNRVRLTLDSSFYGEDRLRTRLESGNVPNYGDFTGSDSTRLGFDGFDEDESNNIVLSDLFYVFPLLDGRFTGYVGAVGMDLDDVFAVSNPMLESSGTGALSRFSRRNPITLRGVEGAGVGLSTSLLEDKITVTGLYLTDDGANPDGGEGVFNGSFSTGAQVEYSPIENLDLALTYVYEYQTEGDVDLTGSTASNLAKSPFGDDSAARAHQVGLNGSYQLGERIVIGAWGGGSFANELGDDDGEAILYTAALNVSFLDLGKEGAVFSLAGGIPPQLVKNEGGDEDEDTSFLIEALYKYPINDNILLTPGAYVVLNPNGDSDNDAQIVGVLRTTFQF